MTRTNARRTSPRRQKTRSNIQRTIDLGTDFWNDSCDLRELGDAIAEGAVGATSNPVIVGQAVAAARETWMPLLDRLVAENPESGEDEIAWRLIDRVGCRASELLLPVYEATKGRKGFLSMQVNPKLHRNPGEMVAHGRALASLAPNVAVKIPATAPGLVAIEALTAGGIRINATVCFTLSQAVACAEAVERGLERGTASGADTTTLLPTITLMVGRLDDHLRRVMEAERVTIDPGFLNWAGVAVFKKAYGIFRERSYRSTLLSAAYRSHLHWTELIGERVIETIPYAWWKQFNASHLTPRRSIEEPVEPKILDALLSELPDFRRAYEEDGLAPEAFVRYGASVHTLKQFVAGYHQLLEVVRDRMLG